MQLPIIMIEKEVKEGLGNILLSLLNSRRNDPISISISKFKKIDFVTIELAPINIFIGANNSGKSSFIQGIQFAISSCQTLELKKVNWVRKSDSRTLALDSSDFLYTPTRQIEHLYHGHKLAGAKTKAERKWIKFIFRLGNDETKLLVSRGKNGGFTTNHHGKKFGQIINSIESPFCVYVPGIAGIPVQEKYEVPIAIKKSATRGDSNNYLRNILLGISRNTTKWTKFHQSINGIYTDVKLRVDFDQNVSEFIDVYVKQQGITLPIDSVGTGLLQTIQIFAYLEYFVPKILLLDEPDSHIHPTKQKLLAEELFRRSQINRDLRIVFSTHSRYILDALETNSQVVHFQDGKVFQNILGSKILLDIGAADADYLFSKKALKYVIVTEDKVDNIDEKKKFIQKFIQTNGLTEDEFVLHSYEGCTKVHFAKLLEGFVRKHIPNVKVVVHIDRDQRLDSDRELEKLKDDCRKQDVLLFITEFSEIENYYCQPNHIKYIYSLSIEDCNNIYQICLEGLKDATIDKIKNFWLRERPEFCRNEDNKPDIKVINVESEKLYNGHKELITPGKELLGKLKMHLQEKLGLDPSLIVLQSPGLTSDFFRELVNKE